MKNKNRTADKVETPEQELARLRRENAALKSRQKLDISDEKEIIRRMETGITRAQAQSALKRNRYDREQQQPLRDARRKLDLERAARDPVASAALRENGAALALAAGRK